jgi:ribosome biogenesis SPOUT family RNA methylase Rps3
MTTDTAVRVTRIIVEEKTRLDQIPYIDHPEIVINKHERTEMPFRYVKSKDGKPIMPEVRCISTQSAVMRANDGQGMVDLIMADAEKGLGDLL